MARTVHDLQVDVAHLQRQISEKQVEIKAMELKMQELDLEYTRMVESGTMRQRDEANAQMHVAQQKKEDKKEE